MPNPTKPKKATEPLPEAIKNAGFSEASLDVLEHFGPETPALLNTYSCAVEDALIESIMRQMEQKKIIQELQLKLELYKHSYSNRNDQTTED